MSISAYDRVWSQSAAKGSHKLILLAIAKHADDDGFAWPGYETLAELAGVEPRQAKRLVKQLAESGEIMIKQGGGRGNSNGYLITAGFSEIELQDRLMRYFELPATEAAILAMDAITRLGKNGVTPGRNSVADDTVSEAQNSVIGGTVSDQNGVMPGRNGVMPGQETVSWMTPESSWNRHENQHAATAVNNSAETLLPDTAKGEVLFERLAAKYASMGRRPPTKFPDLAYKRKYLEAAAQLNGTLERAIDKGLAKNITELKRLIDWVASPKWLEEVDNHHEHQDSYTQDYKPDRTEQRMLAKMERVRRGGQVDMQRLSESRQPLGV